jgi:hypothetical protein
LFTYEEIGPETVPQAIALFAGIIKEFEKKQNELTGAEFYWLQVETYGGEIDVVADAQFFEKEPLKDGVIHGLFWLSGRLSGPPQREQGNSKRSK